MPDLQTVQKPEKGFLVTQSNELIEASYHMTEGEINLILSMISVIQPDDEKIPEFYFRYLDLAELWGINPKNAYRNIKKIAQRLKKQDVFFRRSNGNLFESHWISGIEYGQGVIYLSIDTKLAPHLLGLKKNFKSFNLKMLIDLKGFYTKRMYMFLRSRENTKTYLKSGYIEISIDDFREMMSIPDNRYPTFKTLRQRVINDPKKRLEEKRKDGTFKSDRSFKVTTHRLNGSRKINSLKFFIIKQKCTIKVDIPIKQITKEEEKIREENPAIISDYAHYSVSQKITLPFLKEHGEEYLKNCFNLFLERMEKIKIRNKGAYLVQMLRSDAGQQTDEEKTKQLEEKSKKEAKAKKEAEKEKEEKIKQAFSDDRKQSVQAFWDISTEVEKENLLKDFEGSDLFKNKFINIPVMFELYKKNGLKDMNAKNWFNRYIIVHYLKESLNDFNQWKQEKRLT